MWPDLKYWEILATQTRRGKTRIKKQKKQSRGEAKKYMLKAERW